MRGGAPDREIIDGIAGAIRRAGCRASLEERNARAECGDLALLLFELQSLLLDFLVCDALDKAWGIDYRLIINRAEGRREGEGVVRTKFVSA